jgi:DNA-binding transcriptional regulator GbsR (MarR family)
LNRNHLSSWFDNTEGEESRGPVLSSGIRVEIKLSECIESTIILCIFEMSINNHPTMKLQEGREKFIQAWGTLGSNWGISRTMAQVHALLLVSSVSLAAEEIMDELQISRGNANLNIRALIDWGLVFKEHKSGDRKEYFYAEKDIYKVFRTVVKERRKRELEPVFKVLEEVKAIEGDQKDLQVKAFTDTINGIRKFAGKADKALDTISRAEESWFLSSLLKLMK